MVTIQNLSDGHLEREMEDKVESCIAKRNAIHFSIAKSQ